MLGDKHFLCKLLPGTVEMEFEDWYTDTELHSVGTVEPHYNLVFFRSLDNNIIVDLTAADKAFVRHHGAEVVVDVNNGTYKFRPAV